MPEILMAVGTGTIDTDGGRIVVKKGVTTAHAGHPLVRRFPHLWAPIKVDYPWSDVEPDQGDPGEPDPGEDDGDQGEAEDDGDPAAERAAIRAWAAEQGIEVSPHGKIPASVVDAYQAAHGA